MGLEVVVRPVVLPNIRPPVPGVMAPPDDPTKGLAVLSGGSGKFIGTSASTSVSVSKQRPHKETKRQVDVERIYQMDDDGNINKDNFVDVERMKKVQFENTGGEIVNRAYADPSEPRDNVETREFLKNLLAPKVPDNWA